MPNQVSPHRRCTSLLTRPDDFGCGLAGFQAAAHRTMQSEDARLGSGDDGVVPGGYGGDGGGEGGGGREEAAEAVATAVAGTATIA